MGHDGKVTKMEKIALSSKISASLKPPRNKTVGPKAMAYFILIGV